MTVRFKKNTTITYGGVTRTFQQGEERELTREFALQVIADGQAEDPDQKIITKSGLELDTDPAPKKTRNKAKKT